MGTIPFSSIGVIDCLFLVSTFTNIIQWIQTLLSYEFVIVLFSLPKNHIPGFALLHSRSTFIPCHSHAHLAQMTHSIFPITLLLNSLSAFIVFLTLALFRLDSPSWVAPRLADEPDVTAAETNDEKSCSYSCVQIICSSLPDFSIEDPQCTFAFVLEVFHFLLDNIFSIWL